MAMVRSRPPPLVLHAVYVCVSFVTFGGHCVGMPPASYLVVMILNVCPCLQESSRHLGCCARSLTNPNLWLLAPKGDDAQTVECQVECARLMSSVAGQAASLLIDSGALGAVEGMLKQLGGKHR